MPVFRVLAALACALLACASAARGDAPPELPAVVDDVVIDGLWRTEPHVVTRELPWKKGERVTAEQWELGLTRLWNIGVFSRVAATLERRDGRLVARLALEERWTINLLFRFGGGGGAVWGRLGLYDLNTFGRYIETGALWERFGPHDGGQAWVRLPRLFDERQELTVSFERLARPRREYTLLRSAARFEFTKQQDERVTAGTRLDVETDEFVAPLGDARFRPEPASTNVVAGPVLRLGRVDTLRLMQQGWSIDLRPLVGVTDAPGYFGFAQVFAEALRFRVVGTRVNVAMRARAAASTPVPSQHLFHVGGLDLVRGFPDNHLRGPGYALANVEVRAIAFDSTWLAAIAAVFVDAAIVRTDEPATRAIASVGGGVRVLLPRFVRSGARIDVALPSTDASGPGLSFGVFQFF